MIRHSSPRPAILFRSSFRCRTCRRQSLGCQSYSTACHGEWFAKERSRTTAGAADSVVKAAVQRGQVVVLSRRMQGEISVSC